LSQHHSGKFARHTTKPGKPGLDRPSLFAGMGDDDVVDVEPHRVRILSTLESSRRPKRLAPSKVRRLHQHKTRAWQLKALLGLMGVGIISLLIGFAMVLIKGHAGVHKPDAYTAMQEHVRNTLPHGGQQAPATTMAQPGTQQAVIIDTIEPPAAGLPTSTWDKPILAPSPNQPPLPPAHASLIKEAEAAVSQLNADRPSMHTAARAPRPDVKSNSSAASPVNVRKDKGPRNDEDVALLEAMFTHAGSRKAPVSAAEDLLKSCKGLSGAEAAVCKAKVCVQHPTANVCHTEP
jgi:hypothetical protein